MVKIVRSSSYNNFTWCQQQFFLSYILNFKSTPRQNTYIGTIAHKCLEILANRKLCEQQGLAYIEDEFSTTKIPIEQVTVDFAINYAYDNLIKKFTEYTWGPEHYKKYKNMCMTVVNSVYNPLNLNIKCIEKYFELELPYLWAKDIKIVGTFDLLLEDECDKIKTLEIVDWKSGRCYNWITRKQKTIDDLHNEFQFKLYHYVVSKLYPEYKYVFFTVYYITDGGPMSLTFTEDTIEETEQLIRQHIKEVKSCKQPKLIWPNPRCDWCSYSKPDPSYDKDISLCHFIKNQTIKLGINKVRERYTKEYKYEGGGK